MYLTCNLCLNTFSKGIHDLYLVTVYCVTCPVFFHMSSIIISGCYLIIKYYNLKYLGVTDEWISGVVIMAKFKIDYYTPLFYMIAANDNITQ